MYPPLPAPDSPTGFKVFKPIRFWRCWSHLDPSVHYAFYEFDRAERYDEIVGTPESRQGSRISPTPGATGSPATATSSR